jgi:hypothetical protein
MSALACSQQLTVRALPLRTARGFHGAWRRFVDSAGDKAEPSSARSVLSRSLLTCLHDFVHVPRWPNLENVAIRQRRMLADELYSMIHVPCGRIYQDWRSLASLAVDTVSSEQSKRAHEKALKDFLAWYSAEARPPLSRAIVQQNRSVLEPAGLAPAFINLRLSAIRRLAAEGAENGLLDRNVTQGIVSLKMFVLQPFGSRPIK